jgi:hypothetical protein
MLVGHPGDSQSLKVCPKKHSQGLVVSHKVHQKCIESVQKKCSQSGVSPKVYQKCTKKA